MPQAYTNAFRGPNLAEIDRSAYSNRLMRNEVDRLPQANKAQDLEIQRFEQVTNQGRQDAARKFLGDVFSGIAQSQDPIGTGRTILSNSSFQAALRDVGMDPAQFTIDNTDTPESLQRQSMDLARMMGAQSSQGGVQSAHVTDKDTLGYLTDAGQFVDTGQRVRVPQQPGEPLEQTVGPDGKPVLTPRSRAAGATPFAATAPRPQTEGDKRNALMFDSMVNAEQQIVDMENAGNTSNTSNKWDAMLGLAGMTVAQSDEYKQYEAAGQRWAANLLYMKSGATATPAEIQSTWKQFFPQPGDGPQVVAQKQAARLQEMDSAAAVTGNKAPSFSRTSANTGGGQPAPEGTVIQSQDGRTLVKRNGRWVPQ